MQISYTHRGSLQTVRKLRCIRCPASAAIVPASESALFQHVGAVGDQLGEMHVLLGQQDRVPLRLQLEDGVRHLLDDDRRDAFGRLVEQHQQRIAHQRARDRQHLLLAAAHVAAGPVGHLGRDWETA